MYVDGKVKRQWGFVHPAWDTLDEEYECVESVATSRRSIIRPGVDVSVPTVYRAGQPMLDTLANWERYAEKDPVLGYDSSPL